MDLKLKVLLPTDVQELWQFAKDLHDSATVSGYRSSEDSKMESEILSWSAKWRKESLEHYLPLGWSFAAYSGDQLVGFFLAQPLLYFAGHAQVLWVEDLVSESAEVKSLLVDTAYKMARDKHLQRVLMPSEMRSYLGQVQSIGDFESEKIELKTVK